MIAVYDMGYDAQCEVRYDGQRVTAKAVLEQQDLVVRGALRLAVPIARITEATAVDGWLRIRFDGRSAEIRLGPAARKWAERITNPPSRLTKLGIKPGMRILLVGRIDAAFVEELRAAGATILRRAAHTADVIFFAVEQKESLNDLKVLSSRIVPSGAIWTLREKGRREVTEADTMAGGKRAGLVDVKVVSFSDTLTAEKFVIPVAKRPTTGVAGKRQNAPVAVGPKMPAARRRQGEAARVRTRTA